MDQVLVLTMLYPPEPNFITHDVALALAGPAEVTVVTTFPNYPRGKFYDGKWHLLPRKTVHEGITVWRVPMIPDRSKSQLRRFLSYVSFSLAAAIVAPFVARKPKVVWIYNTPFSVALAALWFKIFRGSKIALTYADLWPESFLATGVSNPGLLVNLLFAARKWINGTADVIIGSTRGTVQRFAEDGVPADRLHYVPVWVPGVQDIDHADIDSPPRVVYVGNMGPGQNLDPVIAGAAELHRQNSPVEFDFYGYGVDEDRLKALAVRLGAPNVRFNGRIEPSEAFRISSRALAQVVTLQPDPMFDMTIPSKLPFCFAAGAPVLFFLRGEAAAIAAQSGASFPFEDNDSKGFAERVTALLARTDAERRTMSNDLRRFYRDEFGREMLLQRYRAIILGAGADTTA